jgi:hypothetical protein
MSTFSVPGHLCAALATEAHQGNGTPGGPYGAVARKAGSGGLGNLLRRGATYVILPYFRVTRYPGFFRGGVRAGDKAVRAALQ